MSLQRTTRLYGLCVQLCAPCTSPVSSTCAAPVLHLLHVFWHLPVRRADTDPHVTSKMPFECCNSHKAMRSAHCTPDLSSSEANRATDVLVNMSRKSPRRLPRTPRGVEEDLSELFHSDRHLLGASRRQVVDMLPWVMTLTCMWLTLRTRRT